MSVPVLKKSIPVNPAAPAAASPAWINGDWVFSADRKFAPENLVGIVVKLRLVPTAGLIRLNGAGIPGIRVNAIEFWK